MTIINFPHFCLDVFHRSVIEEVLLVTVIIAGQGIGFVLGIIFQEGLIHY